MSIRITYNLLLNWTYMVCKSMLLSTLNASENISLIEQCDKILEHTRIILLQSTKEMTTQPTIIQLPVTNQKNVFL